MSRFRVDRDRVEALDDEARAELRARGGEYFVAPTSPDLLWLVRSKPSGGVPPAQGRVVLAGDASGFPLSDLIAFLSQSRWTGTIRVHAAGEQRAVFLVEGEVRGATSDASADRLGEVMVRLGYVKRAELDQTLEEHPPSRLGRALVERGALQAHELWKCITHQVSEIFHSIVLCREGTFLLVDQAPADDKAAMSVQLSMQSLLMDSIRRVDELAHFRKRIPHARVYVGPKQASDGRLEPEEDQVLALCDGQRTVQDLGWMARLSEFDVTKIVFRLLEGGYAQVSERPIAVHGGGEARASKSEAAAAELPPGRDARAVIRIFNQVFEEIRAEVGKQQMDRELIAAANAALTGKALSQSPVFVNVTFDPMGVLPEKALLARFEQVKGELGSEPVASLRQALSDVMFFLLFQAGELLESRQDEALARRVKDLLVPLDDACAAF